MVKPVFFLYCAAMLTVANWDRVGSPGYRVELQAILIPDPTDLATTFDLTAAVVDWGRIQSRVKRFSKVPQISGFTLTLDNSSGDLGLTGNPMDPGDVFAYLNGTMLINIGVRDPGGGITFTAYTAGMLKTVQEKGANKVAYVCQDPTSVLINRSAANEEGTDLIAIAPSQIISELFDFAGFGHWLDADFSESALFERAVGETIATFTIAKGSWWSNILRALESSKGNIRFSGGSFQYYRRTPTIGVGVVTITTNLLTSGERSIDTEINSEHIENRIDIFNDANNDGTYTQLTGIEDTVSQGRYGILAGERNYEFATDAVADDAAAEELDLLKYASLSVSAQTTLVGAIVEPGDLVTLEGDMFSGTALVVVEKVDLDYRGHTVRIGASKDLTEDPWIQADNAQDLDDGQLLW